jgi:tetratricopeptide (TPR) repeat protein
MILRTAALLAFTLGTSLAQPAPAPTAPTAKPEPAEETTPEVLPNVEAAIPETVKALGKPTPTTLHGALSLAVTAKDDETQNHVIQGLNHLHGGWEFEASRHFAAAMRLDPDCLLAHWGMVMSLLNPSPETGPARNAATDRLLHLINAGAGTDLERGYAFGLIKYMEEGPPAAANAFRQVSAKFPNDLQSAIFLSLFSRGGYDDLGSATPDQKAAEDRLLALIGKNPNNPVPLNALLTIRAEAPDLRESLPLARKLCQLAPDYPPYFHLLGHYEWRCGEHGRAASAFGRATSLYDAWMRANKASVADSPEWVRAETYRITALASKGEYETAYAAARKIASLEFPADRASSPGARLLMWDAHTLPARILLRRGLPGNTAEALGSLPTPDSMKPYHSKCLAHWWVDGLRIALETKRLLEAGKLDEAAEALNALTFHGEQMAKIQVAATTGGERSSWNRGFRSLEVLASEIRGRNALAGPKDGHGSAYNWFRAATDRQRPSTLLNPPMILAPMANRLGEYFLAVNRPQDAVDAYKEALETFPNDIDALTGLEKAAKAAKLPEEAAKAAAQIKSLQEQ